jgi:hypothetical protein
MIVLARRASAILYNVLQARADQRPFLLPANVCSVVPETFVAAALAFELIDIDESSLAIAQETCLARLRTRPGGYAGVLFVRPYGAEHDPGPFFESLKAIQPDLCIIDDKCLCRPDPAGRAISPRADVTLFSTGHAKYADLDGGGFAYVNDSVAYGNAGKSFVEDWLDLRPPEMTWGDYQQSILDASVAADEQKNVLNELYSRLLPPEIQLPAEFQKWRFNIRIPAADDFIASAFSSGLFASRHYATLGDAFGGGSFPAAEGLHANVVNLFNDRYFDQTRARRITELVLDHLQRHQI